MSWETGSDLEVLTRQFFKDHMEELSSLDDKKFYSIAQGLTHPTWKHQPNMVNAFKEHLKSVAKQIERS